MALSAMPKKKTAKAPINYFLASLAVTLILSASFINIAIFLSPPPPTVLSIAVDHGAKIEEWEELLLEHPTYQGGWIELYRLYQKNRNGG